ncbi:hypothetical protein LINGRAHAP2_LOCUS3274 [Linum grandiflorum]
MGGWGLEYEARILKDKGGWGLEYESCRWLGCDCDAGFGRGFAEMTRLIEEICRDDKLELYDTSPFGGEQDGRRGHTSAKTRSGWKRLKTAYSF